MGKLKIVKIECNGKLTEDPEIKVSEGKIKITFDDEEYAIKTKKINKEEDWSIEARKVEGNVVYFTYKGELEVSEENVEKVEKKIVITCKSEIDALVIANALGFKNN